MAGFLLGFLYVDAESAYDIQLGVPRPIDTNGLTAAIMLRQPVRLTATGVNTCTEAGTITTPGSADNLGVVAKIFDGNGNEMDYPFLAIGSTAGFVQCWEGSSPRYRVKENATVSAIGPSVGSFGLSKNVAPNFIPGIMGTQQPMPYSGDLVRSGAYSTTPTANCFQIISKDPDIDNDGGTAASYVYVVRFNSAFLAAGIV